MENVFHEVYVVPLSAVPGIQDWTETTPQPPVPKTTAAPPQIHPATAHL